MWTWLGWELPGRCETAAERLYEKSLLSAQALGIDLVGGSSAASQKPVTPQIEAPASKASVSKTASSSSAGKAQAPAKPVTVKTAKPASEPPIEDKIQAEIDGRPLTTPRDASLASPAG
jgi:hypothetical protein